MLDIDLVMTGNIIRIYGHQGQKVIDRNFAAIDGTVEQIHKVDLSVLTCEGAVRITLCRTRQISDPLRRLLQLLCADKLFCLPTSSSREPARDVGKHRMRV